MHRTVSRLAITAFLAVILVLISNASRAQSNEPHIQWYTTFQSASAESRRTGKPMMVDCYADWCPQCRAMDAETYPDPKVAALSRQFVCLRVDATKGEGQRIAGHFKIPGYPTLIFTDAAFEKISQFAAYRNAADMVNEMVHALMLYGDGHPKLPPAKDTVVWRVLLLVVPSIDVKITENGQTRHVVDKLSDTEMQAAEKSFTQFAALVPRLTNGLVRIEPRSVRVSDPITQVSAVQGLGHAPTAENIQSLIQAEDASNTYDSIVVYFKGSSIMRSWIIPGKPTKQSSTYLVVRDVPEQYWKADHGGEVFLNGWTHCVAEYMRSLEYASNLPPLDSGGGETYGYRRSSEDGWCTYYWPLLNGLVPVNGVLKGIDTDMWRAGPPRHPIARVVEKRR